jgi:hypothetical protein
MDGGRLDRARRLQRNVSVVTVGDASTERGGYSVMSCSHGALSPRSGCSKARTIGPPDIWV